MLGAACGWSASHGPIRSANDSESSHQMIASLGRGSLAICAELGDFTVFIFRAIRSVPHSRGMRVRLIRAVHEQGVRCLLVVVVVGAFTGLVLGLQGFHVMTRFGSENLVGGFVALTLTRELAPVLAALVIVGQAGSALAAELGIQRNSEQIDALGTMGIDPLGYLVAPRLIAAVVAFPILTTFFALVGGIGGYLSASLMMGLDGPTYWSNARETLQSTDVFECLVKALAMGAVTVSICAYTGFNAHRLVDVAGARAVSASTTRAVVLASIAVLAVDFLLTSFLT